MASLTAGLLLSCAVLTAQNGTVLPTIDQLFGANFRRADELDKVKSFGFAREYHDWALDVGYPALNVPDCRHEQVRYRWNPSFDGASTTRFDDLYRQLDGQICPVPYGNSPFKLGTSYWPGVAALERKPVCEWQHSFSFQDPNSLTYELGSYRDYTLWCTQFAARYGKSRTGIDNHGLANFLRGQLDAAEEHPNTMGANNVHYLEIWNEQDKNWNFPQHQYYFTPAQYAALLSAVYDGHNGNPSLSVNGVEGFSHLGVHRVDPSMKIVMGGLSAFRGCYIEEMVKWCDAFRPGLPLPFQVVNFHHYNNDYYSDPRKTPAYVWDFQCQDPNSSEIQLTKKGISPEASGLRERLEYSLRRLLVADRRFADMEFWVSETGYDTQDGSTQVAHVDGQDNYETQAQWMVRTYLEASAATVFVNGRRKAYDRILMYDIRDMENRSPGLFATSGIFTSLLDGFSPKTGYFYLQTLKNTLRGYRFEADHSVLNMAFNSNRPMRVYEYRNGNDWALTVWSPTEQNIQMASARIYLPSGLNNLTEVTLTTMREPSTVGYNYHLPVRRDENGYAYVLLDGKTGDVQVSERPLFIRAKAESPEVLCYGAGVAKTYCNAIRLSLNPVGKVQEQARLSVYCAEGAHTDFSTYIARQCKDDVPAGASSVYIGNLKPNTVYTFWIVPGLLGHIPKQLCPVIAQTSTESNCAIPVRPDMVALSNTPAETAQTPWRLFDEQWISPCSFQTSGHPSTPWETYRKGGRMSITFDQPMALEAIYLYIYAGVGKVRISWTDEKENTGGPPIELDVISGQHNKWQYISDFADKKKVKQIFIELTDKDVKIGEIKFCGEPADGGGDVPPPTNKCGCQPVDLSNARVSYVGTPPPDHTYTGLFDSCADRWGKTPRSIIDEQDKFFKLLETTCDETSGLCKGNYRFNNCGESGSLQEQPLPVSEWFPGWGGGYPYTLRLDFNGRLQHLNRIYLFDTNDNGQLTFQVEDANGKLHPWGNYRSDQTRAWCLPIDDPRGREIRALYITRHSPSARFAEIGLCSLGKSANPAGISERPGEARLAPNPANSTVTVQFDNSTTHTVTLINATQQVMDARNVTEGETSASFEVADLPRGVYWVVLRYSNGKREALPLLVQD
jgi:Secretion system C-terminal sorting domain